MRASPRAWRSTRWRVAGRCDGHNGTNPLAFGAVAPSGGAAHTYLKGTFATMSDYGTPPPPAPQYNQGPGPVEHPKGTLILILGILSIVCLSILGPFAWVMGNRAIQEIDANPSGYTNRGIVQAGRICGIVGTVLLILSVIWLVILVATGAFTAMSGA